MSVRVTGGEARGRRLRVPPGLQVRPASDRVRQAVFNVLGQRLHGEAVLDLYAGAGAYGIEALSRGAGRAVLVERDPRVAALARENARSLGYEARCRVVAAAVARAVPDLARAGERFALAFLDPPYALGAVAATLELLEGAGVLEPGARVVAEHGRDEPVPDRVGVLARVDARRYGGTAVGVWVSGGAAAPEDAS